MGVSSQLSAYNKLYLLKLQLPEDQLACQATRLLLPRLIACRCVSVSLSFCAAVVMFIWHSGVTTDTPTNTHTHTLIYKVLYAFSINVCVCVYVRACNVCHFTSHFHFPFSGAFQRTISLGIRLARILLFSGLLRSNKFAVFRNEVEKSKFA